MKTWLADARWCEHLDPGHRPLLDEPLVDAGRPWLGRSARKVRRAGKGVEHLTAKERHRLRIALKQLRYDTNSLSSLYAEKKVRPYVAALCDLQDVLGNLNDLVVARKLVGVGKNRDRTVIDERLRATEAKRLKALAPAWRAFRKIPPFWK
jgi:CHAD domain-containing protein